MLSPNDIVLTRQSTAFEHYIVSNASKDWYHAPNHFHSSHPSAAFLRAYSESYVHREVRRHTLKARCCVVVSSTLETIWLAPYPALREVFTFATMRRSKVACPRHPQPPVMVSEAKFEYHECWVSRVSSGWRWCPVCVPVGTDEFKRAALSV
ncbi:hypothetical protein BV22DRAFT_113605 [Leucogyrophana mollusca]|uniref:Uncharacterized protein n=1 Tax=Leucogyrophana mollusca TaxID=85980 RepID=A0ACB8BY87_9AGAM|nr:hypothetical protein BV22DRAFT_113605 [Leucogyrophana mollusca]